jgi:ABC-type transport system substrate-binding protein
VTFDQNDRIQQRIQVAKLLSDELPSIVLTFTPNIHAYSARVKNVSTTNTFKTTGRLTWDIERWELA